MVARETDYSEISSEENNYKEQQSQSNNSCSEKSVSSDSSQDSGINNVRPINRQKNLSPRAKYKKLIKETALKIQKVHDRLHNAQGPDVPDKLKSYISIAQTLSNDYPTHLPDIQKETAKLVKKAIEPQTKLSSNKKQNEDEEVNCKFSKCLCLSLIFSLYSKRINETNGSKSKFTRVADIVIRLVDV